MQDEEGYLAVGESNINFFYLFLHLMNQLDENYNMFLKGTTLLTLLRSVEFSI